MTEATANWADPANEVIDMTTGASEPMPASRASTPNETPNTPTATANGTATRTPLR